MTVYLINPSDVSFGIAVITPRWLFVLASATPAEFGDPKLVDEALDPFDAATVEPGDLVAGAAQLQLPRADRGGWGAPRW